MSFPLLIRHVCLALGTAGKFSTRSKNCEYIQSRLRTASPDLHLARGQENGGQSRRRDSSSCRADAGIASNIRREQQERLIQQLTRDNGALQRKVAGFQLALQVLILKCLSARFLWTFTPVAFEMGWMSSPHPVGLRKMYTKYCCIVRYAAVHYDREKQSYHFPVHSSRSSCPL